MPARLIHVAVIAAIGVLFYLLARERIGPWAGLVPTALLMVLGRAHEISATPSGLFDAMALPFGLGVLLALGRGGRWANLAACACLLASLASSDLGIPFLAGAGALVWMQKADRRRRPAWVVALPAAAYLLWHVLADGTEQRFDPDGLTRVPSTAFDLAAGAAGAITGLFREPGAGLSFTLEPGYVVAVVIAGLIVFSVLRGPAASTLLRAYALTLAAIVLVASVSPDPLAGGGAGGFLYATVLLVLLIGAEAPPEVPVRREIAAALALIFASALLANSITLHELAPVHRADCEAAECE